MFLICGGTNFGIGFLQAAKRKTGKTARRREAVAIAANQQWKPDHVQQIFDLPIRSVLDLLSITLAVLPIAPR